MERQAIGILLAGGQTIFRRGLCGLLAREHDMEVLAEVADTSEAARLAGELQPQLVLLDLSIPQDRIGELLRSLASSCTKARTIVLASEAEKQRIAGAIRLGARGAVLKNSAATVLVSGIRSVVKGMYWAADRPVGNAGAALKAMAEFADSGSSNRKFGLTRRELEIVEAIITGHSNRQIAEKLSISEDTVKHHISHLFDKLGVFNRLELTLFAIHHGLVG